MQNINPATLEVENCTSLGLLIHNFSRSPDGIEPLGHPELEYRFGYMDGGCLAFAKALLPHLESSELCVVIQRNKLGKRPIIHHFAVQFELNGQTVYADADGVAYESELLTKMALVEQLPGQISIIPLCEYEERYQAFDEDEDMIFSYSEINLPTTISDAFIRYAYNEELAYLLSSQYQIKRASIKIA